MQSRSSCFNDLPHKAVRADRMLSSGAHVAADPAALVDQILACSVAGPPARQAQQQLGSQVETRILCSILTAPNANLAHPGPQCAGLWLGGQLQVRAQRAVPC